MNREATMRLILERLRVDESGCWLWQGQTARYGYGRLKVGGRRIAAHRLSYELHMGCRLPDGIHIDHLCRIPACVNPAHLEPVTPVENTRRGFGPTAGNFLKTHCPQGHEYTPENTYQGMYQGKPARGCRECRRVVFRRAYLARLERGVPPDAEHGVSKTYFINGCRCDECKAAAAEYRRDLARRKKAVAA